MDKKLEMDEFVESFHAYWRQHNQRVREIHEEFYRAAEASGIFKNVGRFFPTPPLENKTCYAEHEVVENQALNQTFYYCRTCKKEIT